MGNCCVRLHGHDSNMVWAGDDWGSPMSERFTTTKGSDGYYSDEKPKKMMRRKKTEYYHEAEEEKETAAEQRSALLVVDDNDDHKKNVMKNSSTEVKVRITKKQLEELLGNVEVKGLSVQQLLEQLMNVNTSTIIRHHRSWRPALNTIPEMIEAI